jgi:hypothetical protein
MYIIRDKRCLNVHFHLLNDHLSIFAGNNQKINTKKVKKETS